jgi:Pyruvate/2-oxoacid:ferredoxin oxidoreductase delta subunit
LLIEDPYEALAKKLDSSVPRLSPAGQKGKIPKGWIDYLKVLIDPEDLNYLIKLNVGPNFLTLKRFAKKIKKDEEEALQILERLIDQNCVLKIGSKKPKYAIHQTFLLHSFPPLSYHNYPKEKAIKLAELSFKNMVDDGWYKVYSGSSETPTMRVIPVYESIESNKLILPYEDVSKIIDDAKIIAITKCACKTRTETLGKRDCKEKIPLETCFYMNHMAKFIIERGLGRKISKEETKRLCKEFNQKGLVHTTENFGEGTHSMLCNCCSCCCNPLGGITMWDKPHSVATANYFAKIKDIELCERCGTCETNCIFKAITLSDNGPIVNEEKCMGCGICTVNCSAKVIELIRIEREEIPNDFFELGFKIGREMD